MAKAKKKKKPAYGNRRVRAIAHPKDCYRWVLVGMNHKRKTWRYAYNADDRAKALRSIRNKLGTKGVMVVIYPVLYQKPIVISEKAWARRAA